MIGGNLLHHVQDWQRVTTNQMVLSTVKSGFQIKFRRTPFQRRYRDRPHTPEQATVIDKEVKDLLVKQATRLVSAEMVAVHPGFVSHLFAVAKKSGGWRPVLDLSQLNRFIRKKHFQMESVKSIRAMIRRGDFFASLDLKDAFLHVPMDPRFFKWLRFMWNGQLYEFTTLPFGLTLSPWVFTKVLREVVAFLRSRGVRLAIYLDDILIMGSTYEEALRSMLECRKLLEQLGFTINLDKSVMTPSQRIEHLGFLWDSEAMQIQVPAIKLRALRQRALSSLRAETVTLRSLSSLIGSLQSVKEAVLPCFLHCQSLVRLRNRIFTQVRERWASRQKFELDPESRSELEWWSTELQHWNGHALITPQFTQLLQTDASEWGWGAVLGQLETSGRWLLHEAEVSSNQRELRAVLYGLESFLPWLHHSSVMLETDNTTAIAYIKRQGGFASRALSDLARAIWNLLLDNQIVLQVRHIAGVDNVTADRLSRLAPDYNDWMLNRKWFRYLDARWGRILYDLFATWANAQTRLFYSYLPQPHSSGTNAFRYRWMGQCYANPPWGQIPNTLWKIKRDGASVILIAPIWVQAAWFYDLMDLAMEEPLVFPDEADLFLPVSTSHASPIRNPSWRVAAWRLSGNPSLTEVFQRRRRQLSSLRGGLVPTRRTRPIGHNGWCSVLLNHGIQFKLL